MTVTPHRPGPGGLTGKQQMPTPAPPGGSGSPIWAPPPGHLLIRTVDLKYEVVVMMGDGAAQLTPGGARLNTMEMPWRTSTSSWSGQELDLLEVDVILEGWPRSSTDGVREQLIAMGRPRQEGRASGGPKAVELSGNLDGTDKVWWPPTISPGRQIWRDGKAVRRHYTLSFVEYEIPEALKARKRSNQRDAKGKLKTRKPYVVKDGDTLSSIAQDVLGQAKRWKDIAKLNPRKSGKKSTPRRSARDVKKGERLKMPQD